MAAKYRKVCAIGGKWLKMKKEKRDIISGLALGGLLLLVCVDRLFLLFRFSSRWLDDDQGVLWVMTDELLKGRIHQVHFLGQAYNIAFEPLFAAPLVFLGVPYAFALPLVTILLSIFPFVFFALLFWNKGRSIGVYFALTYLLTLPLSYSFVASLPRGFVGGLAVGALAAALFIFEPGNRRAVFFGAFLAVLSCSINPNALLLLAPLIVAQMLDRDVKKEAVIPFVLGIVLGGLVHFLTKVQYMFNRDLDRYRLKGLRLSLDIIDKGFDKHDFFFSMFSPFGISALFGCFLIIVICVVYSAKKKEWKVVVFLSTAILMSVASFTLRKVYDGSGSLFYPLARPFLALPLNIALALQMLPIPSLPEKRGYAVAGTCFAVGLLSVVMHVREAPEFDRSLRTTRPGAVCPQRVSNVKVYCKDLLRISKSYSAEIIVFVPGGGSPARLLGYVCPLLEKEFPPTILSSLERRRWRVREEHDKKRRRFFFYNSPLNFPSVVSAAGRKSIGIKTVSKGYIVVDDEGTPVRKLMKILIPRKNAKKRSKGGKNLNDARLRQ